MNTTPIIRQGRVGDKINDTLYSALIIYTKDFIDSPGHEKYKI